jgi:SAM-dependent methyltransferase
MTEVLECPICHNQNLVNHLECRDYTVSNETFALRKCSDCNLLITTRRPDDLSPYYQSEDYISHSDRNDNTFSKIYSLARHITTFWKVRLVQKHINNHQGKILDVGCGTGTFLKACKDDGLQISGVEPSDKARSIAARLTQANISSGIDDLQDHFDIITMWHVLEHVPNPQEQITKLINRLNPGGTILIAVPNHESYDARKYKSTWAGYDVPRHLWHFSQKSIGRLFENNGLVLKETIPMKLDAFYVSMLSEKYVNGSLGIPQFLNGMFVGFISNINSGKAKNYSSLIYIARRK